MNDHSAFERVLILGDPRLVPTSLWPMSHKWFAAARVEEVQGCLLPLQAGLQLRFPEEFNIDAYMDQRELLIEWASGIAASHGAFDRIIAPTEYTIEIGALLREALGVPGWMPGEAERVRNKGVMKARMRAANVHTADFIDLATVSDLSEIRRWADGRPGRIVLKPKTQAGSRGVRVVDDGEALAACLDSMSGEVRLQHLVEDFMPWPLLHIDGLVRDGELLFLAGARYLDPCLSWLADGRAMGSVLLTDKPSLQRVTDFAHEVVEAMQLRDMVFHLEAFDDGNTLHFLEIAGRPGGAAIVPHLRSQYGVDLQEEMIRCDLGLLPGSDAQGQLAADAVSTPRSGGWIATPMPTGDPCRVVGMRGLDDLPGSVFDADLPRIGSTFNLRGDEGLASGRFHVRTQSETQSEEALRAIADRYALLVSTPDGDSNSGAPE
ncbi:MAG: hypothetical protein M3Q42_05125 [Pseudomonadota bacterium]|nr:hypothetical protein [Pseudomonadota bacterium]